MARRHSTWALLTNQAAGARLSAPSVHCRCGSACIPCSTPVVGAIAGVAAATSSASTAPKTVLPHPTQPPKSAAAHSSAPNRALPHPTAPPKECCHNPLSPKQSAATPCSAPNRWFSDAPWNEHPDSTPAEVRSCHLMASTLWRPHTHSTPK